MKEHLHSSTHSLGQRCMAAAIVLLLTASAALSQSLMLQTLEWTSPTKDILLPNASYPLIATASSGLAVTFQVIQGPAKIDNGNIVATNVGTVIVEAVQEGDADFAAIRQSRTFNRMSVVVTRVGGYNTSGEANAVDVVGHLAYVADGLRGLKVLDVSDPTAISSVERYDQRYLYPYLYFRGVTVAGATAFVADSLGRMQILDISNPAEVVPVSGYATTPGNFATEVQGDFAYVAAGDGGFQIFDLRKQTILGGRAIYQTNGIASAVNMRGSLAYVAFGEAGLVILDASNTNKVIRLGGYKTEGNAEGVCVSGNLAYVADGLKGLQIFDVSNQTNVIHLGGESRTNGYAYGVQVSGALAFVANWNLGLQIFDVSNPSNPMRVGGYERLKRTRNVKLVGDLLYIADLDAGLQIFKVHESIGQAINFSPSEAILKLHEPVPLVGTASSGLPVIFQVVAGPAAIRDGLLTVPNRGRVVVAANQQGNEIFAPTEVLRTFNAARVTVTPLGTYQTNGTALGLDVVGPFVYVADGANGLQILDATNPGKLIRLGGFSHTTGAALKVKVVDGFAYLGMGDKGLEVLNVSNPVELVQAANPEPLATCYGLKVVGRTAYLGGARYGVQALGLS